MGLEAVEIVMEVEDTFDIAITDAEAEQCRTPGRLIDLVMAKVGRGDKDRAVCLTQRAFHRLRAALMKKLGCQRCQIRAETRLETLFPRPTRKARLWQVLQELGVTREIDWAAPRWLHRLLLALVFGGGPACAVVLSWHPVVTPFPWLNLLTAAPVLAGVCFAGMALFLCLLTMRVLRHAFPPSLTTVGDLSRWLVAQAPEIAGAPPGQWTREQIAEKVRHIIIDQLGCAADYHENADFIKDLGLGG